MAHTTHSHMNKSNIVKRKWDIPMEASSTTSVSKYTTIVGSTGSSSIRPGFTFFFSLCPLMLRGTRAQYPHLQLSIILLNLSLEETAKSLKLYQNCGPGEAGGSEPT